MEPEVIQVIELWHKRYILVSTRNKATTSMLNFGARALPYLCIVLTYDFYVCHNHVSCQNTLLNDCAHFGIFLPIICRSSVAVRTVYWAGQ